MEVGGRRGDWPLSYSKRLIEAVRYMAPREELDISQCGGSGGIGAGKESCIQTS